MKQNWWKLLVVAILVVAVGVVLAIRNQDTEGKTATTTKPDIDTSISTPVEDQTQENTETEAQVQENPAPETAKPEDKNLDTSVKPDINPDAAADKKPKNEPAAKPAAVKKEKPSSAAVKPEQPKPSPEKLPKMIELGAEKCIPCKLMKPIIEELQKDYKGKLEVVYIDVREDKSAAEEYGVQSIPVQVFIDENGKEFFRHTGFFSKEEILAKFKEHGMDLSK